MRRFVGFPLDPRDDAHVRVVARVERKADESPHGPCGGQPPTPGRMSRPAHPSPDAHAHARLRQWARAGRPARTRDAARAPPPAAALPRARRPPPGLRGALARA
ncbi:hypothetical protein, partial [Burkholderia pseudomallei]|uniref:hypothetical protein n=1 Tax=Burkholderia pseudomallei TaxID=28450 RepID=UPI001CA56531